MKNKTTVILSFICILVLILVILVGVDINNKKKFVKPYFETNAIKGEPEIEGFEEQVITVRDNYRVYVNPEPSMKKDRLIVNFTSLEDNNIWLKVRIIKEDEIIGESGIIKPGEYVKEVKIRKEIKVKDEITYVIMGYEKETYMSEGTIKLSTKVGE